MYCLQKIVFYIKYIISNFYILILLIAFIGYFSGKVFNNLLRERENLPIIEGKTVSIAQKNKEAISITPKISSKQLHKPQQLNIQKRIVQLYNNESTLNWNDELEKIIQEFNYDPRRNEIYLAFFSLWAKEDFVSALKNIEQISFDTKLRNDLIIFYANNYPKEALNLLTKDLLFTNVKLMIEEVSSVLIKQNPDELFEFLMSASEDHILSLKNKGEACREIVFSKIMNEIGFTSLDADKYINEYYEKFHQIPQKVFTEWTAQDPAAVEKWLKLKNLENAQEYKVMYLTGLALTNTEKAKAILESSSEKEISNYLWFIKSSISDEKTSLSCMVNLKEDEKITSSDLSKISSWTSTSPDKALEWINELPVSHAKDISLSLYIKEITSGIIKPNDSILGADKIHNPYKESLMILEKIQNQTEKDKIRNEILEKWKNHNPNEFYEWKNESRSS